MQDRSDDAEQTPGALAPFARIRLALTSILGLSLWLAGAPSHPAPAPAPATLPPNILLLVAEDLGPRIGAFGDPLAHTPNLDRLARQGVRYTSTFTTSGVCAPSRAALILGMHAISTGTQHMRSSTRPGGAYVSVPPAEAKAFPEWLRRAGYFAFQHAKLDYQFSRSPFSGSGPFTIWDAEDNPGRWRDRAPEQPFFGMITFMVTHESGIFAPLGSRPHSLIHFVMQLARFFQLDASDAGIVDPIDPADVVLPPYYPDVPEIRRDLARHYENIQIMDHQVGQILDQLSRDGLAESTIVIWTTDHGDGLPRAKRSLYDSGLHVPMIIRWPEALRPASLLPGEIDSRLVSFVDLSATILDMAGVPVPANFQGRSFLDPASPPRRYVFAARDRIDEIPDLQRAVRDERFKYIRSARPEQPEGHRLAFRDNQDGMRALWRQLEARQLDADQARWFEPVGEERLFDLEKDPFEVRDVSRDPGYAETLDRMRSAYRAWRERVPDWSDQSEAEMVAAFQPDGVQPVTRPPTIALDGDRVVLDSPTVGSSLGYRIDLGPWRLYTGPFDVGDARQITARAVRYGWLESPMITRSRADLSAP